MFKIGQWIQGPSEAVNHWRFKRKAIIGRILEVKESGYLVVEDAWSYKWTVDESKVFARKKPNTQKKTLFEKMDEGRGISQIRRYSKRCL